MDANKKIAKQFGKFIAKSDFVAAHGLLTKGAQKRHSPDKLRKNFEQTTAYAPGPVRKVEVMGDVLGDWPDKRDGDIAWVYVSLYGDDYVEAVSVTLAEETGVVRIRHLEWGRP